MTRGRIARFAAAAVLCRLASGRARRLAAPCRHIEGGPNAQTCLLDGLGRDPARRRPSVGAPRRRLSERSAPTKASGERLRQWIALPTIANMGINHAEGADHMRRLALDAGFTEATIIDQGRSSGVRDARCRRWPRSASTSCRRKARSSGKDQCRSDRRRSRRGSSTGPAQGDRRPRRGLVQKGPEMAFLTAVKRSRPLGSSFRSIWSSSPRARKRSDRPISRRRSPRPRSRR